MFAGLSVSAGAGLAVQAGVALALGLLGGGLMLAIERLAVAITGAVLVGGLVFAVGPLVSATLPWFAPVIGDGDWQRSWRRLLGALRDDIDITNYVLLNTLGAAVAEETFARPAALRVLDILLWMRQPTAFGVV